MYPVVRYFFAGYQHRNSRLLKFIDHVMNGQWQVPSNGIVNFSGEKRLDYCHAIRHIAADGYPDRHDAEIQVGVADNDLMDDIIIVFDFPCRQGHIWPKPVNMATLLTPNARMLEGETVKERTQLTYDVTIHGQASRVRPRLQIDAS